MHAVTFPFDTFLQSTVIAGNICHHSDNIALLLLSRLEAMRYSPIPFFSTPCLCSTSQILLFSFNMSRIWNYISWLLTDFTLSPQLSFLSSPSKMQFLKELLFLLPQPPLLHLSSLTPYHPSHLILSSGFSVLSSSAPPISYSLQSALTLLPLPLATSCF